MTLTSTFWYEIIYPDQTRLFFQFLDTTENGLLRCRLCDGTKTTNVFRGNYMEVIPHGEINPCEQN